MQSKHLLLRVGSVLLLCVAICGGVMADTEWAISAQGPDGAVAVSSVDFYETLSEYQITVQVDDELFSGVPVWRVLRLADAEKTLGPGDLVVITGVDKTHEVPYPVVYKSDSYLLIYEMNGVPLGDTVMDGSQPFGPVMYLGPGFIDGTQVGAVSAISITEAEEWSLQVSTADSTTHISMDEWNNLLTDNERSAQGPEGYVFSGIQLKEIIESFAQVPADSSILRITAQDGYSVEIPWAEIKDSDGYIIADTMNEAPMPKYITGLFGPDVKVPGWPLILIDPDFPGEMSVGNIIKIEILS